MSNITIELSKEDRKILEGLMASVTLLASALANSQPKEVQEKIITEATAAQPAPEPATPDAGHPVDEISPHGQPEPVAEPEPAAEDKPKWTKEDLQARVQALAAPGTGKTAQVRAIVKSYAERVGLIPEDKYDEFMDKLTALEKEV
jgi:hypothetical protein